jgi:hypothetical protein
MHEHLPGTFATYRTEDDGFLKAIVTGDEIWVSA